MPTFRPDGERLLTLETNESLFYQYSWPDAKLVAKQRDFNETDDDEAIPGYYIVYLKSGLVVVQSANSRLYLFDPAKMERLTELVIEGFAPVPINEAFPGLKDKALYSPIGSFERFGDILVATTGRHVKNQAMLLFSEDDLI